MLIIDIDKENALVTINPHGALEREDFVNLVEEVDPLIKEKGALSGFVINAQHFPGWHDFGSLLAHLKFVEDHHRKINKVAIVSDSAVLSILPKIADHFVAADVRHFDQDQLDAAKAWCLEG